MTSFNRRDLTLACLTALFDQRELGDIQIATFLLDDGSTDGTTDAVQTQFPQVRVLKGDGSLFWNGGMRKAFAAALAEQFDAYIFLNDDTRLYNHSVKQLVSTAEIGLASGAPAIIIGSTLSSSGTECTYGGFVRQTRGVTMQFERVLPDPVKPIPCDTMNGNFVLIPSAIAEVVGNIESGFRHQFGDLDYGLRAKHAGFQLLVAPGYLGECSLNSSKGSWRDPNVPFMQRWKSLMSPKGAPIQEWLLFTYRHYGWRWMLYAFSPYIKTIVSSFLAGCRAQVTRRI